MADKRKKDGYPLKWLVFGIGVAAIIGIVYFYRKPANTASLTPNKVAPQSTLSSVKEYPILYWSSV